MLLPPVHPARGKAALPCGSPPACAPLLPCAPPQPRELPHRAPAAPSPQPAAAMHLCKPSSPCPSSQRLPVAPAGYCQQPGNCSPAPAAAGLWPGSVQQCQSAHLASPQAKTARAGGLGPAKPAAAGCVAVTHASGSLNQPQRAPRLPASPPTAYPWRCQPQQPAARQRRKSACRSREPLLAFAVGEASSAG
ncbi:hypothetical protein COO60DRAFT_1479865 [Scenedesmus sp. NREL 46B-D3]|nr:hypothetical protein COO60DRAFT_1479865 [Scenedesmus sp. NREL 46B-D3]